MNKIENWNRSLSETFVENVLTFFRHSSNFLSVGEKDFD